MAAVVPNASNVPMDALGPPPSFSGRKGASTTLPGRIELPNNPLTSKFNGAPPVSNSHSSQASIPNLLTPPSNIPGESLSPISSGSNSASNPAAHGLPPYTPTGYWQPTGSGLTPYMSAGASGTTPPSWTGSNAQYPHHPPPTKGLFSPSPSLNALVRGTHPSPPTQEGVPPPNYDLGALPPFPHSLSPPHHQPLPGLGQQQPPPPPSNGLHYPAHSPPADGYQRLPPTPGQPFYGSGSSTASAPASYPPYSGASPVSQSPIPRMSLSPINQAQPYARPYPQQYGMPGQGPLMSNVHQQHQPMGMVGMPGMMPYHSGHAASMHMYNHPGAAPPNDRPFKCDQCPQSFNRNHDLKRHKRIHLAVKPFPCLHCEKSFSRKDALKRHILVKGCGKANHDGGNKAASDSADDKDESSDDERMQS